MVYIKISSELSRPFGLNCILVLACSGSIQGFAECICISRSIYASRQSSWVLSWISIYNRNVKAIKWKVVPKYLLPGTWNVNTSSLVVLPESPRTFKYIFFPSASIARFQRPNSLIGVAKWAAGQCGINYILYGVSRHYSKKINSFYRQNSNHIDYIMKVAP